MEIDRSGDARLRAVMRRKAGAVAQWLKFAWFGITEPFRLDRTPAWISLVVLLVGVPVLAWRIFHGFTAEDFGTAVLTATLLALVWTAHYTFRLVKHSRQEYDRARDEEQRSYSERIAARRALGASVIIELGSLSTALDVLWKRIYVGDIDLFKRPQLREAMGQIGSFDVMTAQRLAGADSGLRMLEARLGFHALDLKHYAEQFSIGGIYQVESMDPATVRAIREAIETVRRLVVGARESLEQGEGFHPSGALPPLPSP